MKRAILLFTALLLLPIGLKANDPLYWRVKLIDGVTPEEWHRHSIHAYTDWNGPDTTWERIPGRWEVRVTVDTVLADDCEPWLFRRTQDGKVEPCGGWVCFRIVHNTTYTPLQPVFLNEADMERLYEWLHPSVDSVGVGLRSMLRWEPSTMRTLSDECARKVGTLNPKSDSLYWEREHRRFNRDLEVFKKMMRTLYPEAEGGKP